MTANGETDPALAAAWEDVDRADGTLQADFVKVRDGFYTQRIVLDGPIVVGYVTEESIDRPEPLAFRYEPCRIPRYRTELVWRRADPLSLNGGTGQ